MEAEEMLGDRPRWLAAALAISMLTIGVPLAPTGAAQNNPCDETYTLSEDGWIMLANPDEEPNRRVSRAMHHFVFEEDGNGFAEEVVTSVGRTFTNGIDAYVVDLGDCKTQSNSATCIQRSATEFGIGGEGFALFEFRNSQETAPDIHVAFYNDNVENPPGWSWDPTVPPLSENLQNDGDLVCLQSEDLPIGAQYAVVYVTSGNPAGVQIDDQLYGPYTSHFNFYYCLEKLSSACDNTLPDDDS